MRLQNIDYTTIITMNQSHQRLRLLLPDEDVPTITATDHILAEDINDDKY